MQEEMQAEYAPKDPEYLDIDGGAATVSIMKLTMIWQESEINRLK